uniref:Uncharacterized protein n=1 Tax=Arundo donax TaxID=35708 RepID=A0A0A9AE44_ARUDO
MLSGAIPSSLGRLSSLSVFNLGYNNLTGLIPSLEHFLSSGLCCPTKHAKWNNTTKCIQYLPPFPEYCNGWQ